MTKYVYSFGRGKAEGSSVMRNLLGGKGCELAEMTNLGIPVPPGFTITTQAWAAYNRSGAQFPEGLWEQRSWRSRSSSRTPGSPSATRSDRCWCPYARARACRCPA